MTWWTFGKRIPARIKIFLWQVARNCIPSGDQVLKCHGPGDGKCVWCGQDENLRPYLVSLYCCSICWKPAVPWTFILLFRELGARTVDQLGKRLPHWCGHYGLLETKPLWRELSSSTQLNLSTKPSTAFHGLSSMRCCSKRFRCQMVAMDLPPPLVG